MPRCLKNSIVPLNPEIEKSLRWLRKIKRRLDMGDNSNTESRLVNPNPHLGNMQVDQDHGNGQPRQRRSIREASQSNEHFEAQLHAIPQIQADSEIKGPLYNGLPKFQGLASENPNNHFSNLYLHCQTMERLASKIKDMMWKIFHLTLEDKSLEWHCEILES